MEVLADHYHVDLRGFDFERFFPSEFPGENALTRILLWIVPFASDLDGKRGKHLPLTLAMIEHAMLTKRWKFVTSTDQGQS